MFSCIPGVYGFRFRERNVTYRPIDDWMDYNPFGCGPYYFTGFLGHDFKGHNYWVWFDGITAGELPDIEYPYAEYGGFVREKVMSDGSLKIKVVLHVEGLIVDYLNVLEDENGDPLLFDPPLFGIFPYWFDDYVFFGYMDFLFQLEFTLDATYPGSEEWEIPPGEWVPGGRLPDFEGIYLLSTELGIHLESYLIIGYAPGTIYEPGWTYDMPIEELIPIGPANAFLFFYATFDNDDSLVLPFGASGFTFNILCVN
jgi:hypothetical protein